MNNKGFTLMEIMAVLMILAVVVMFALPGIRAIRDEIYYYQAKSAAVKMADAMRSYYQRTKGSLVVGQIVGRSTNAAGAETTTVMDAANNVGCNNNVFSGIPANAISQQHLAQLFACDYLLTKDFAGLPYQFEASDALFNNNILVKATGLAEAKRHAGDSWCVYRDSSVAECNN